MLAMRTTTRRVIIEWDDEDRRWLVLMPDGTVKTASTAGRAADIARKVKPADDEAIITVLEWRHCPAGFVPPGA